MAVEGRAPHAGDPVRCQRYGLRELLSSKNMLNPFRVTHRHSCRRTHARHEPRLRLLPPQTARGESAPRILGGFGVHEPYGYSTKHDHHDQRCVGNRLALGAPRMMPTAHTNSIGPFAHPAIQRASPAHGLALGGGRLLLRIICFSVALLCRRRYDGGRYDGRRYDGGRYDGIGLVWEATRLARRGASADAGDWYVGAADGADEGASVPAPTPCSRDTRTRTPLPATRAASP